jgi:hypothetical protein
MKKLLFSLAFCALFMPLITSADGVIVPPNDYYMWETSQQAAIFYESSTQMETMVVSMNYTGTARDFAWIIPVPTQPTVEKGSQTLFSSLETITGYDYYYDYDYALPSTMSGAEKSDVTVVEQKTVDYYDITVLSSTDSKALSKWLNDNGYQYPEKYAYIFNDYINNDWYFVAAKIAPTLTDDTIITSQLASGTATPLQLTFTAKNIIYPMKISQAVTSNQALSYVNVTLYVITDHRQEAIGYSETYANNIEKNKIEELAFNTQGDAWVNPEKDEYFLTKLIKYQYVTDMTEDVFPKNAAKDTKIHSGYEWDSDKTMMLVVFSVLFTAIGFATMILSPFALIFIILTLIYYFAKNQKVKIICVVLQIIDTAGTLCFLLASIALTIYSFIEMFNALDVSLYIDDEIFASCGTIAASLILLLLFACKLLSLLIQKRKYKKIKKV